MPVLPAKEFVAHVEPERVEESTGAGEAAAAASSANGREWDTGNIGKEKCNVGSHCCLPQTLRRVFFCKAVVCSLH